MRLVASNDTPPHIIELDARTIVGRVLGEHARTLYGAPALAVGALAHGSSLAAPPQVPGIGPANVKLLAATDKVEESITTTYQLIGKFLSLKAANTTCVEHCDMFYYWLQAKGVNAGRNNIVLAIAEKCEVFLPGCYDASQYED